MNDDILVEWDNKYSIGIRMIDDQHKELITLTNTLFKGCLIGTDTAIAYFLGTIRGTVEYVKYHFTAEEKLLEEIEYPLPLLERHKEQHRSFVLKILEDVKSFQDGKKFVPNAFVRYLKDWILSHIAVMDKQYAVYIENYKTRESLDGIIQELQKVYDR
jgi:hemerythrin